MTSAFSMYIFDIRYIGKSALASIKKAFYQEGLSGIVFSRIEEFE